MEKKAFGILENGEKITLYVLKNHNGMEAAVTDLGAVLVTLKVPDKDGKLTNVVLGYDSFDLYAKNPSYFGATIGRSGNRIDRGEFEINGKTYQLAVGPDNVNLHSAPNGYLTRKWNVETEIGDDAESITFYMTSPDGDQGYPGNLDIEVTYTLTEDNELMIQYYGLSDQDTIFNMTNHSYFNLNGDASGDVLGHIVTIHSDAITKTDERLIPTGELMDVSGTPFDFREPKTIGQDIGADDEALRFGHGYDHNFVVNSGEVQEDAELIAVCEGEKSGIIMEVYTDLPGVQMYTSNGMNFPHGTDGAHYGNHQAVCFETQYAPDAIHHPNFASPVLRANEERMSLTVYRFFTKEN